MNNYKKQVINIFELLFEDTFDENINYTPDMIEEWDSLAHIRIIMKIESAFTIKIPEDSIMPLYTSIDIISNYIEHAVKK